MNKKIIVIGLLFAMFGCDEYLDIVPDQTQQIDLLFERKEVAYTALATCYAYLPKNDGVYTSFMMMSDDCLLYTSPSPRDRTRSRMPSSA